MAPVDPETAAAADPSGWSALWSGAGALLGGLGGWLTGKRSGKRQDSETDDAIAVVSASLDRVVMAMQTQHEETRRTITILHDTMRTRLEEELRSTRKLMHEQGAEFVGQLRDLLEEQRVESEVERRLAVMRANEDRRD